MRIRRKRGKYFKLAVILIITIALTVLWMQYFRKNVESQVYLQSTSLVHTRALEVINVATSTTITTSMNYNDYVTVERDSDNNIVFMQGKTMEMNRLARLLALNCQDAINNMDDQQIEVPIGAFTGSILLANYGKKVKIPLTVYSNISSTYLSTFNAVGINQTRHTIYIKVNVYMDVVLPLASYPIDFDTYVLLAESIIVGKIPDVYIDSLTSTDLLDLIP